MTTISHTDNLLQKATASVNLTVVPGVWVRLLNNSTATNYYSTAVTDVNGAFTHSAVPGDYSLYYGLAATVIGTPTLVNAHYAVPLTAGDDAALGSLTAVLTSPYAPTANPGGNDLLALRTAGKPWFDVTHPTYGAKGDGKQLTNGAITTGTNIFTSATAAFTSADVGKPIIVAGAGAAAAVLSTTIAGYTSGGTFDGHTNLYAQSSNIRIQGNRLEGGVASFALGLTNTQGQTDIMLHGNMVSPYRQLFTMTNMPAAPSATVKRISIIGNHVISHSGFTGGVGCIEIAGNAAAANGGVQGVVIENNIIPASGAGGTGCDVEITALADDVYISGNRLGSPAPLSIAAAATNVVAINNIRTVYAPTTGALGANVTSVTFTGGENRGTIAIVMAGALAANTRIATCTYAFTLSPYGATVPRYRFINSTSGAGLANVNFYVQATAAGVSFDIACNQALALGTYQVTYDIVPAGSYS